MSSLFNVHIYNLHQKAGLNCQYYFLTLNSLLLTGLSKLLKLRGLVAEFALTEWQSFSLGKLKSGATIHFSSVHQQDSVPQTVTELHRMKEDHFISLPHQTFHNIHHTDVTKGTAAPLASSLLCSTYFFPNMTLSGRVTKYPGEKLTTK